VVADTVLPNHDCAAAVLARTAPAGQSVLGLPGPGLHLLLLVVSLGVFAFILGRRIDLLRGGAPDPRCDQLGRRVRDLLVFGFLQARQPRYPLVGVLHIVVFTGFLILSIRSLTLLGEGFSPGFADIGAGYAAIKDWTALMVLLSCVILVVRRACFRPARYHDRHATGSHAGEAYLILGLIAFLMVADAVYEGADLTRVGEWHAALPLASLAALLLSKAAPETLSDLHQLGYWAHNVALLFFLCYLPLSKHFHVLSALPNIFLHNLTPGGRIKPPRHDQIDLDQLGSIGVGQPEDFTWKHLLDFMSCTDCGRCSDHCPAYNTGTPLSPRMISIKCRDFAYRAHPILGRDQKDKDPPPMVGAIISDEELWACTTCGACEEACPVLIEYVDKIVDMRRFLIDEGRVPAGLQKPLADLEKKGNPYGKMPRKRDEWVGKGDEQCAVRLLKPGDESDLLFFTDSCAALDPRIQQSARALASVFEAAGLEVGTLGRDEVDSGNEARRLGEEGLFEILRDRNLKAMESRGFARVVTTDPHAMNALRHDYALDQPVLHHSQLLAELVASRRIALKPLNDGRIYTFHDPCYLGRHNGEYDAPRKVLAELPGIRTIEMDRSRNRSFCCGGGSLYLFYEGESESRASELRLDMAAQAGAQVVVTACPFCLINLEDAVKTSGRDDEIEVIDLAELVARSLDRGRIEKE
jgi:Fe-S oxidoreductase